MIGSKGFVSKVEELDGDGVRITKYELEVPNDIDAKPKLEIEYDDTVTIQTPTIAVASSSRTRRTVKSESA